MKVRTFPIVSRYRYDPALVPTHGTPLWDTKHARPIPPTATVRFGTQYFTPKQLVYILNKHPALVTPEEPNPSLTMPRYILHRDDNPTNILYENLHAVDASRRWKNAVTSSGALVPQHLLVMMSAEDRLRMGIHPNEVE